MVTLDGIDFVSQQIIELNAKAGKLIFNKRRMNEVEKEKERKDIKLNDYIMFTKEGSSRKKR